jgi:hypothetical protein
MVDMAHGVHGRDGADHNVSAGNPVAVMTELSHFLIHGKLMSLHLTLI